MLEERLDELLRFNRSDCHDISSERKSTGLDEEQLEVSDEMEDSIEIESDYGIQMRSKAREKLNRSDSIPNVSTVSLSDVLSLDGSGEAPKPGESNGISNTKTETSKHSSNLESDFEGPSLHDERNSSLLRKASVLRKTKSVTQQFTFAERGFLTMLDTYVERMRQLLSTWFDNLLIIDSDTIPKQSETTGKLYTPTSVEIFGIIDDQIAVVADVDKSWWLYKVIDAVLSVMDKFQSQFHERLEHLEKQGFEFAIAGINNAVRCYEYAQDLSEHIETMLPPKYFELLEFEPTYTNFLDTAKEGIPLVSNCIFRDSGFLQVLKRLFKGEDWYRGDVMEIIIATLKDYCDEISDFVEEILISRLMETILERVVSTIFEMLLVSCKDCLKNRPVDTINRMEADSSLLRDFFPNYISLGIIEKSMSPLDSLRELVAAEDFGDVIMSYTLILQAKPTFQPQHVETLLASRSDINKKERAELLQQCDERWQSSLVDTSHISPPSTEITDQKSIYRKTKAGPENGSEQSIREKRSSKTTFRAAGKRVTMFKISS